MANILANAPSLPWVHVSDPASTVLDDLAREHQLHELDIEDCRHHRQIAKAVEHTGYSFLVIKTIEFDAAKMSLEFADFDLFLLADRLITVEEGPTGIVEAARRRLATDKEFAHPRGIVYVLLDYAVDAYLPVLDQLGDAIDALESEVLERPNPESLGRIFAVKRALIEFRRSAVSMRELVNHMLRSNGGSRDPLFPYIRDVYDHLVRALDFAETYRDLVNGTLDIYLSAVANRTNDAVKVLTVYSTVALPFLAITSFYGMNVALPYQQIPHAVWVPMGLTAATTLLLLAYLKRKQWI
jgi:magnesium transporter